MNLKNTVLVLFLLLETVNSEKRKSSLTFAIDDTGSMTDDIAQVKLKTKEVFSAVLQSNASVIENFILVTFNDPSVALRTITTNERDFMVALDAIAVNGGGNCPEMSLTGIELAVDSSYPNSFLFVFTDASSCDYENYDIVQTKALKKSIQVTFLLTGDCECPNCLGYRVYHRLAAVTGGKVFEMAKPDLNKALDYIIDSIQSKKCLLSHKYLPSGGDIEHPFSVDCKVKEVILSLVGVATELKVFYPNGTEAVTTELVKTIKIYVVKMNNVAAGDYIAKVKVLGEGDLDIKGVSSLSFEHGFSPFRPASINETTLSPISGKMEFLSIVLVNEDNDVKPMRAEIRDMIGNVVLNLTLHVVNELEKFYVTDKFVTPDYTFKIAVVGVATNCNNKEIVRVTIPAIEPLKINETVIYEAPTIKEIKTFKVEDNGDVSILCTVSGNPKPEIIWKDKHGNTLNASESIVDDDTISGKQVTKSLIETNSPDDNIFTCTATNKLNTATDSVKFTSPKESPLIDKTVNAYNATKGESVEMFCRITQGKPKPDISWYFKQKYKREYIKLDHTDEKLHVYNLGAANTGSYKCVARNTAGKDSLQMELYVEKALYIEPVKKFVEEDAGNMVKLDCIVRGPRNPSVRWYFNDKEIVNGGRHHIFSNHTLSFKARDNDSGVYKCEAKSRFKTKSRTIDVDINAFSESFYRNLK